MTDEFGLRDGVLASVRAQVRERWGPGARLSDATVLRRARSVVVRVHLDAPQPAPASLIVKQAGADASWDPDDAEPFGAADRFHNEWIGLAFLDHDPRTRGLAPGLYGADRSLGFVAMEDLGGHGSVADALLADDPSAAREALLAWGRALGRLNARTAARGEDYRRFRAAAPARASAWVIGDWLRQALDGLPAALALVDQAAPESVLSAFAAAVDRLRQPGPFDAFSPNDICPDNNVLTPTGLRFFDLEGAGFHHALLDGAYAAFSFPTCWCVGALPDGLEDEVERAYRNELARGCPAAADDRVYSAGLGDALAIWLAWSLADLLPRTHRQEFRMRDRPVSTGRQRTIARLEAFARRHPALGGGGALAGWASDLAARLRQRWPPQDCEMAPLPAFQPRPR